MADVEHEEEPRAPSTTARQLLVDWANQQDGWLRKLVLEVLAAGKPGSGDIIREVYNHFLAEKGLMGWMLGGALVGV